MSCQGCVGAVKRVLGKMEGVESYEVDLEQQKVTVKGNVQPDAVLQTVSKTGKKTAFWEAEALAETEAKPAETEFDSWNGKLNAVYMDCRVCILPFNMEAKIRCGVHVTVLSRLKHTGLACLLYQHEMNISA
ncbi:hypothetical protein Godav_002158 [Gossypium davidsonii]|uniref:HMA domain-containing protein n=2 Tax=Gossypium TaxID=3633 RepID=A0A7J8SVR3_GOSDV|nr:hypothetical protein [Gossypium davidsonii]MBA0665722.1 hypothetical protein [Gossypium klotzschianum]